MRRRSTPLLGSHGNELVVWTALAWVAAIVAAVLLAGARVRSRVLSVLVVGALASVVVVAVGSRAGRPDRRE